MTIQEPIRPAVVVVDDEPAIVDVVCQALEDTGITAMGCEVAVEAFGVIQQLQPRLVILDVRMPAVDGFDILEELRADPQTAALPILFLTAGDDLVLKQLPDYQERGAELLPKPFDVSALIEVVERMIALG